MTECVSFIYKGYACVLLNLIGENDRGLHKAPPLNPWTYIYRYYNIHPTVGS